MRKVAIDRGFSMIELLVVIVIIGILTAIAMQSMNIAVEDQRRALTEREMERLADAIVGDPEMTDDGTRSDFGYVGDVGSFPPNLQGLLQNPGGYATWRGPYLPPTFVEDTVGFKLDEWGTPYTYSGGITISSTGSGSTIFKKIADATSDYLLNHCYGEVRDYSNTAPGVTYADSVSVVITVPDGSGGTVSKVYPVDSAGMFMLDSLPVGRHTLDIIYLPNVDTLHRFLTILPRHKSNPTPRYRFAQNYFGGTGGGTGGNIQYVAGSAKTSTGNCDRVEFDIVNNSGSAVTVSYLTVTWSAPTAYYEMVKWGGPNVFNRKNPRAGSGDQATFSSSQVINDGQTITIRLDKFKDVATGNGNKVNMSNTDMTVTFSDGSTIQFNSGACN